jgi:hypothetical protein
VGGSGVPVRRKHHHAHAIQAKPASVASPPPAIERPSGALTPNTIACSASAIIVRARARLGGRSRSQRLAGAACARGTTVTSARADDSSVAPAMVAS